jgi:N-succinyldiaminopimelate aminotransferase
VSTTKQFLTYVASGPFQYAVAVGLGLERSYFADFAFDLQAKRDRLTAGLIGAGFTVFPSSGTYFVTTDVSALTQDSAMEFCRALPYRCGVVAIPNSVFYANPDNGRNYVRFAFCKTFEVIDEAVSRLASLSGVLGT